MYITFCDTLKKVVVKPTNVRFPSFRLKRSGVFLGLNFFNEVAVSNFEPSLGFFLYLGGGGSGYSELRLVWSTQSEKLEKDIT